MSFFKANSKDVFTGIIIAQNATFANNTYDSYYYLPYDTTYRLLVQFGSRPSVGGGMNYTITYKIPYTQKPTTFLTTVNPLGSHWTPIVTSATLTNFVVDANYGAAGKPAYSWMSIGLVSG